MTKLPGETSSPPTELAGCVGAPHGAKRHKHAIDHESSSEVDVKRVQTMLNIVTPGVTISSTGIIDATTVAAIRYFQRKLGYKNPDGFISPKGATWENIKAKSALMGSKIRTVKTMSFESNPNARELTEDDIKSTATQANIEFNVLKAVTMVESSGKAFENGRPIIRLEAHRFSQATEHVFDQEARYKNISGPYIEQNDHRVEKKQVNEYSKRLEKAAELDEEAAVKATSWGAFQIMGEAAGATVTLDDANTPKKFVSKMFNSGKDQLEIAINFMENKRMGNSSAIDYLRSKNFEGFAKIYNGTDKKGDLRKDKNGKTYADKLKETYNTLVEMEQKKQNRKVGVPMSSTSSTRSSAPGA